MNVSMIRDACKRHLKARLTGLIFVMENGHHAPGAHVIWRRVAHGHTEYGVGFFNADTKRLSRIVRGFTGFERALECIADRLALSLPQAKNNVVITLHNIKNGDG